MKLLQDFDLKSDKFILSVSITPKVQPNDYSHVCSLISLPVTPEKIARSVKILDITEDQYDFYKFCIYQEPNPYGGDRGELIISPNESINRINEIYEMYEKAYADGDEHIRENLNSAIGDMSSFNSFDTLYDTLKYKTYLEYPNDGTDSLSDFEYGKMFIDDNGVLEIPYDALVKSIDYELLGYNLRRLGI